MEDEEKINAMCNIKEVNEKIQRISKAMYNLNRSISLNHIALKKPLTESEILLINKCLGEWIKQLREISEEGDKMTYSHPLKGRVS